jgi:hypothetical protein
MLLVGSNRQEYQLDPRQEIPRLGGGEVSQQEWFLSWHGGHIDHQNSS